MKVRKMAESEKPKWVELRSALWPDCPAERHLLEMDQLQRSDGVVLLAEDSDGQIVGFAEISIRREHVEGTSSAPVPYLEGWYVIPGQRRRGIGRALIKSAESRALEAGFLEIASDAESDNHDGIRAHRDLGFREVGRSVHFVRPLGTPRAPRRMRILSFVVLLSLVRCFSASAQDVSLERQVEAVFFDLRALKAMDSGWEQSSVFAAYHVEPEREIPVLLARESDDAATQLECSEAAGWVGHVGLESGCSPSLLSYFERTIRNPERRTSK